MRLRVFITLFILAFLSLTMRAEAQQPSVSLDILQHKFKNFEYDSVLTLAEKILANKERLSNRELIKVYRMKAIAHYAKLEMNASLRCFLEILKIDPTYSLDPVTTSPKIINFFNEIKQSFRAERAAPPQAMQQTSVDTTKEQIDTGPFLKGALVRSMILPGWGQHYLQDRKKGWLLGAASSLLLTGSIYFTIDCRKKERDYLNEINSDQIEDKYERYNLSYKTRNILIVSYVAVWLYSQADMLFFQKDRLKKRVRLGLFPSQSVSKGLTCQASVTISF